MYKTIQEFQGHYSTSEGILIHYDHDDLRATTFFRVYENVCPFGNAMNEWEIHKELVYLQGVEFESFTPTVASDPGEESVMLQDYDPSSFEAPITLSTSYIRTDSLSQTQKRLTRRVDDARLLSGVSRQTSNWVQPLQMPFEGQGQIQKL